MTPEQMQQLGEAIAISFKLVVVGSFLAAFCGYAIARFLCDLLYAVLHQRRVIERKKLQLKMAEDVIAKRRRMPFEDSP